MRRSAGVEEAALEVDGLGVRAGGRDVLGGVSFGVARGEVLAVLGPNGAGKTTLLEALAGLRPYEGRVRAMGRVVERFADRARAIAFLPDEAVLPEEASVRTALGLARAGTLAARFGVSDDVLGARASEVSRGESKRAELAATLGLGRPIALLDEPFAALDPRQLAALLPAFREVVRDAAVVVTVHQMSTAERVADRLLLLSAGRAIAHGTLEELRARAGRPGAALDEVFLALLEAEDARA